jgi:hypothetical protein
MRTDSILHGGKLLFSYASFPDKNSMSSEEYTIAVKQLKALYGDSAQDNPFRVDAIVTKASKMILSPLFAL